MIGILAKFFRGVHLFVGITPPPPGHNEPAFVLTWLGMIAFFAAFSMLLFYLLVKMHTF
jgi:hypothetical protein